MCTRTCTVAAALVLYVATLASAATLPTATGRSFALSDPAWKVFIPSTYVARPGNVADLLVHFHGDPQTFWDNAKFANLNTIIVTVNYSGLSSAYETPFSNAALFQQLMDEALTKVRQQSDIPDNLNWDKMGVSSFSAGYGAVRQILKSATYRNDIDCLLAADSLYASFTSGSDHTPLDSQMLDYRTYANLATTAAAGGKTFIFSHSQVPTFTYCETRECADDLMAWVGTSASPISTTGLGTLQFYRHAKKGNFEVWGATGSDGDSHLEHLRYIGQFLQTLPLATVPEPSAFVLSIVPLSLLMRRARSRQQKLSC